jgi:predicted cupin superfamily sugar epimerase
MMPASQMTAAEVIALLQLAPHPEGGHFVETFRDAQGGARGRSTAIYFLLAEGEVSRWHRVDAVEVWHWYAGAPLELAITPGGVEAQIVRLGADLRSGERPQAVVPAGHWQSARSLGAWSLVGCTVAPGFVFEGFELANEGFDPQMPTQRS